MSGSSGHRDDGADDQVTQTGGVCFDCGWEEGRNHIEVTMGGLWLTGVIASGRRYYVHKDGVMTDEQVVAGVARGETMVGIHITQWETGED